jgi:hypothetical protein
MTCHTLSVNGQGSDPFFWDGVDAGPERSTRACSNGTKWRLRYVVDRERCERRHIWMVGDTAVSGGALELRQREFTPKIELSAAYPGLVGFAGAAEYGGEVARRAAAAKCRLTAIAMLQEASADGVVDFLHASFNGKEPVLLRIADGGTEQRSACHIGVTDAFETFQRIRLGDARRTRRKHSRTSCAHLVHKPRCQTT